MQLGFFRFRTQACTTSTTTEVSKRYYFLNWRRFKEKAIENMTQTFLLTSPVAPPPAAAQGRRSADRVPNGLGHIKASRFEFTVSRTNWFYEGGTLAAGRLCAANTLQREKPCVIRSMSARGITMNLLPFARRPRLVVLSHELPQRPNGLDFLLDHPPHASRTLR